MAAVCVIVRIEIQDHYFSTLELFYWGDKLSMLDIYSQMLLISGIRIAA